MTLHTSWIIWFAVIVHMLWGVCLLVDPAAAGITSISHLGRYTHDTVLQAIIMLGAGLLAAVGLLRSKTRSWIELLWVTPQQIVLCISAIGAMKAIHCGVFADGTVRTPVFLLADQGVWVLTAALHTVALVEFYGGAWLRSLWTTRR